MNERITPSYNQTIVQDREDELNQDREKELREQLESNIDTDSIKRFMAEEDQEALLDAKREEYLKNEAELEQLQKKLKRERGKDDEKYNQMEPKFTAKLARDVQAIMAEEDEKDLLAAKQEEYLRNEKELESLKAFGIDWTRSEEMLAKDLAHKTLEKELKGANVIKKIWKGRLFRNYYEEKYTDEYLDGDRTDKNGVTLAEGIRNKKDKLVDQFVFDLVTGIRYTDREEWDSHLVPVEKETNEKLRSTIEDYARFMFDLSEIRPEEAKDPEIIKEIDDKFNNYIDRLLKQATKEGKITGDISGNNYLSVAKEAAKRYQDIAKNARNEAELEASLAQVTAGFQAYNYKSISKFNIAHKNNIDKIIDRLGPNSIGNYVPARRFYSAVERTVNPSTPETDIIDDIEKHRDLIGGDEGIEIMQDQSPMDVESQIRWGAWWETLSKEGKKYVCSIVKKIDSSPDYYNIKWGEGFRKWLTLINARTSLM